MTFNLEELLKAWVPLFAIAAAAVGHFIVYWNNVRLERLKGELKLVNDQLEKLYGPLFALNSAGSKAVRALLDRKNLQQFFFEPGKTYDEGDIHEYRLWMSEIFMPLNLRIEKAITENAHLINEDKLPDEFGSILAHIASYKAVIKAWSENPPQGNVSYEQAVQSNTAIIPFPREFPRYVEREFNQLKARQAKLLGLVGRRVTNLSDSIAFSSSSLPPR